MEKSDICFHSSSHLSKQVGNSFTVTGRARMAFLRYQRCLLLKTKGTTNSDVSIKHRSYFKALLGLAKVVIVLVILFGSCASLPGNQTVG